MVVVDVIMLVVVIISVGLLAFILADAWRPEKYYGENADAFAVRQRNCYLRSSVIFVFIYYWCILMSILSTLIVLHIGCFEETGDLGIKARVILYSALSLFTTIVPHVVDLIKLSRIYRKAFYIIETAILENSSYAKAYKECERVIKNGFDD